MRLTFENRKFVLRGLGGTLPNAYTWQLDKNEMDCVTTDIKAAREFSEYADASARMILQRAILTRYAAPRSLPSFLDHHQADGINWVLTRSRSYLAHAPGAGKTCEAIVASQLAEGEGKVVFIVPPSLTVNWGREIEKFTQLLGHNWASYSIIPESARQSIGGWGADFIIIPDSMISKSWVLVKLLWLNIKFLAVDEASRFKDHTSRRAKALFGGRISPTLFSSGIVYRAKHAVLLDGSPMPNRAMELWGPTFAMCPEAIDFMNEEEFGFRFGGARINDFGRWEFKHSSREEELKTRLQKDFMHVVLEEKLNHPERQRSMIFLSKDCRTAEMKTWEKTHLSKFNFSDISEDLSQGDIATYRRELAMSKIEAVSQYVIERLNQGEQILLFCWHRDAAHEFEKRLKAYKPVVIIGGTSPEVRESAIEKFNNGGLQLLILNIIAGGRGHNLPSADRVIFAEPAWNDEMNKQCEKRASRKGRASNLPVKCDYMVVENSMDEIVLNSVFRKAHATKKVIG